MFIIKDKKKKTITYDGGFGTPNIEYIEKYNGKLEAEF